VETSAEHGETPESPRAEATASETRPLIPTGLPRTTDDLGIAPPPRRKYPVTTSGSLRELARARELLVTFVERDLRVRYKQTILGGIWAILQPFILMVIFSVVFGKIAKVGSEGVPYPIFSYSALVPWGFFSGALTYGTTVLIQNAGILRKIYLPREVFPLASVLSSGVDFAASWVILLPMLLVYGSFPQLTWLAYPLLMLALALFAVAGALFVSAAAVHYRDIRYVVPTMLQVVLYLTPVAYPLSKAEATLPAGLRHLYPYLNPLVPIVDGFRRVLIHGLWPEWAPLTVSAVVGIVLVALSYRWYKRIDPTFPDVI
jgi:lipopolysaccharide transport system permease protein